MTKNNDDWGNVLKIAQANYAPTINCFQLLGTPSFYARYTTQAAPSPDGTIPFYFPKAINPLGGFPYDIKIWIPGLGLREQSTENDQFGWNDPAAASACKSYDATLMFLPSTYDPTQGEITLSDCPNGLPWRRWKACAAYENHNLGPCRTTFIGPLGDTDWGGVIGQSSYYQTRYWYGLTGGVFTIRELFNWASPWGWFGWIHQKLVNGVWTTDNSSIHNTVIVSNPVPYDPCDFAHKKFF